MFIECLLCVSVTKNMNFHDDLEKTLGGSHNNRISRTVPTDRVRR